MTTLTIDDISAARDLVDAYTVPAPVFPDTIIQDVNMVEQFRFPRTRKKRIIKKWAKRPENFRPSDKVFLLPGGMLVCHPVARERIMKAFVWFVRASEKRFHVDRFLLDIQGVA